MPVDFSQLLNQKLTKQKAAGNYRSLKLTSGLIDFCSNDYLGLARSTELQDDIKNASLASSALQLNGSTGSRLLSGNSNEAEQIERQLSDVFRADAAVVFQSGYLANLAVLSSLPQKGDTIIYDEAAHASIKDGARLSLAQRYSFQHNNIDDLERKLKKATGNIWIVVESIYSMDGDLCPLADVVAFAKQHGAYVILDEAHSTGIWGPQGSGLAVENEIASQIDVRIHTFGKALGCHGACVVGSSYLRDYLINFSRPFIYSTAPPPHFYVAIDRAIHFLRTHRNLTSELFQKIDLFAMLRNTPSNSGPIQTVMIGNNETAKTSAAQLQAQGFDVRAILSPTVRAGSERLRICLHAFNTNEEIERLCNSLNLLM